MWFIHPIRFIPAVALLVACTGNTEPDLDDPDPDTIAAALEQDNGGFDTADAVSAFGVPELYADAQIEVDAPVDDAIARDQTVIDMDRSATVEARRVMVLWGRMPADPLAIDARDWSGELRVSRGAVIVDRTIAFEDATDRILARPSREAIAFESRTRPFADGLVVTVLDPTPGAAEPLTLTYTATAAGGGATYTLDLSRLADGPVVVDAGDGNRIIAVGKRRDIDPCAAGFMRGRWHQLAPNLGSFLGVVANHDGTPLGHVRGIYGERRTGDQVWFGKFVDRTGRFIGIMGGEYRDGAFAGRWLDRAGDRGLVHGVYFPGETRRAGAWAARWAETSCDR